MNAAAAGLMIAQNLQSGGAAGTSLQSELEKDKEIKLRLQEVMTKYNIKQVEVARETGKFAIQQYVMILQGSTTLHCRYGCREKLRGIK
jgi:hypothetical protein